MRTLLLVEDDKSLGTTLHERLQKEGYKTFWAEDLAKASEFFNSERLDLIILDVGLPDGSGFDFALSVRKTSAVPFIFVTAQTSAEHRLKGYEIGAEEYIPKPFHLKELLLRVGHVLENHAPPESVKVGALTIDFEGMAIVDGSGRREQLALKEMQILKLLIEQSPKVVSRDDILDRIWGEDNYPSQRTVDNIIVKLRQLLSDHKATFIRSVRGVGYQWLSDEE